MAKLAKVVKKETEKVLESVKVKCDVCGAIMEMEDRWFPSLLIYAEGAHVIV